ncbi:protein of unknown function [Ruminococcaceae bacterium YRB3002]|nr:protein of unknown function [Ruminococcaceae bacterium YRB3002]
MAEQNVKKSNTGLIIGLVCAIVVIAGVMAAIYFINKPKAQQGTKAYTVAVVDKDGNSKDYTGKTDAEFLRGLMDELQAGGDFSYVGEDSDYGLYITTINGITPDYNTDGAYWAIYVNGEYGMYGADAQPVNDGDSFKFVYEVYQADDQQ